jgi:hypothetical protein
MGRLSLVRSGERRENRTRYKEKGQGLLWTDEKTWLRTMNHELPANNYELPATSSYLKSTNS